MRYRKALLLMILSVSALFLSVSPAFAAQTGTELSTACSISPGETKTILLLIQNSDTAEHSYTLNFANGINGYEAYCAADGVPTKSVQLSAGESARVDLVLTLKGEPSVHTDTVTVTALREDGQGETISISILISQDYVLTISSMLSTAEVMNGKSMELSFSVHNGGAKELKAVRLEPELPYKWIAGNTSTIDLKPGETGTLQVAVEVPASQTAGNFTLKCTAVSDETTSGQISLPVTVKTRSSIGYVMIGALLLAAIITVVQFARHGRR